jgi:hypothetical protein
MLQEIAQKPASLSGFGERFVGGKGVVNCWAGHVSGFDGASSNLRVSGHSQMLSLYNHHDIRGGGKRLIEMLIGSVKS